MNDPTRDIRETVNRIVAETDYKAFGKKRAFFWLYSIFYWFGDALCESVKKAPAKSLKRNRIIYRIDAIMYPILMSAGWIIAHELLRRHRMDALEMLVPISILIYLGVYIATKWMGRPNFFAVTMYRDAFFIPVSLFTGIFGLVMFTILSQLWGTPITIAVLALEAVIPMLIGVWHNVTG